MNNLEEARRRWLIEQGEYGEFAKHIEKQLEGAIQNRGILFTITSRPKEMNSLIRKLMLKADRTYDSIGDKAGVRVIVRYKDEVGIALEVAKGLFETGPVENTSNRLEPNTVGYLSMHTAVRLRPEDPLADRFAASTYSAELQVRTMAQHLWAETAHDSVYKYDELSQPLPNELKRRIYILAGVVELADEELNQIERLLPSVPEVRLLRSLERNYYKLTVRRSDPELSIAVIRLLSPLYGKPPEEIIERLNQFFETHADILHDVYGKAQETQDRSVFLHQPEALMIYDLLEHDLLAVREAWSGHYPDRELERVANDLGFSFD